MEINQNYQVEPASFRDRSGFVFYHRGSIYRQVNQGYGENYDYLVGHNNHINKKLQPQILSIGSQNQLLNIK